MTPDTILFSRNTRQFFLFRPPAAYTLFAFGGTSAEAPKQGQNPSLCSSPYPDIDRLASGLGNVATIADTIAAGAATGAILTSETVVGGITLGAIAAGAKFVSLSATGLKGALEYASGNNPGLASTGAGFLAGLVTPFYIKGYQSTYGAGKSARDKAVQGLFGVAFGAAAGEAVCTNSQ